MSTNADELRRKKIKAEIESEIIDEQRIRYRGARQKMPVIALHPADLLLNHDNHRLSAELKDHPQRDVVFNNPHSDEAQKILAKLLSETEMYSKLKQELKDEGQFDCGLITADGLLVNGNTRAVALMDLGIPRIEVAVLPDSAGQQDIMLLEMDLQMNRRTHQDYTYTNELMFIDSFLSIPGNNVESLISLLGTGFKRGGKNKIAQARRILGYINEVRGLSKSKPVPYAMFNSKKTFLTDMDDRIQQKEANGEIDEAEMIKWTRLSGLVLGLSKDQVRQMDENFIDERLDRRLSTDSELQGFMAQYVSRELEDQTLQGIVEETETIFVDMKKFLSDFINQDEVELDDDGIVEQPTHYIELKKQMGNEARQMIEEKIIDENKQKPHVQLREIRERVATVRQGLPKVVGVSGFKAGEFTNELRRLKRELEDLTDEFERQRT